LISPHGIVTSFIFELLGRPVVYAVWKSYTELNSVTIPRSNDGLNPFGHSRYNQTKLSPANLESAHSIRSRTGALRETIREFTILKIHLMTVIEAQLSAKILKNVQRGDSFLSGKLLFHDHKKAEPFF